MSASISEVNNRLNKQTYLIEKIMTSGYDANSFSEFMMNQKEGGDNVDNYTYDEILQVSPLYPSANNLSCVNSSCTIGRRCQSK